jgi:hypothetical protein
MAKPENSRSNETKENKYREEDRTLHADKAAEYPPTLNKVTKQNNPV